MTESEQAAAILAALNAALTPAVAYEYGRVPGSNGNPGNEPTKYVLVDLTRRYVDGTRGDEPRWKGYRLGTRYVAKSISDARTMRERVTDTLESRILHTSSGVEVGPFVFEASDAIAPDSGFQVGTDTWTF